MATVKPKILNICDSVMSFSRHLIKKKGTGTNWKYLKSEPILNVLTDYNFELI